MRQSEINAAIRKLPQDPVVNWNLSSEATKLVRKAVNRAEELPSRFNMDVWGLRFNPTDKPSDTASSMRSLGIGATISKRLASNPLLVAR